MAVTEYTPEIGAAICLEIACGASVKKAAETLGFTERAFFIWLTKYPVLIQDYMRARSIRADTRFESSSELMQDLRDGKIDAQQARVMLDEIKWKCGKEDAKKYGDSTQLKHADADGGKLSFSTILGSLDGGSAGIPGNSEEAL